MSKYTLKQQRSLIHEIFDFDQIRELRLALLGRKDDLEKIKKKEDNLGLDVAHIRERERLLDGTDIDAGLLQIITPMPEATDQADVFFDREPEGAQEEEEEEAQEEPKQIPASSSAEEEEYIEADYEIVNPPEKMFGGWLPDAELLEEAREYLAKNGWPAEEELDPEVHLDRTIWMVRTHGWGIPLAESEEAQEPEDEGGIKVVLVGETVKSTADLRRTFDVKEVLEDGRKVVVTWGSEWFDPIDRDDLRWDAERSCWLTDVELIPGQLSEEPQEEEKGPNRLGGTDDDLEDGPISVDEALADGAEEIPAPWHEEEETAGATP